MKLINHLTEFSEKNSNTCFRIVWCDSSVHAVKKGKWREREKKRKNPTKKNTDLIANYMIDYSNIRLVSIDFYPLKDQAETFDKIIKFKTEKNK